MFVTEADTACYERSILTKVAFAYIILEKWLVCCLNCKIGLSENTLSPV